MKIAERKRQWYEDEMRHLIIDKKMTKSDIARSLGILPQALNNIEIGVHGLSDKFLDKFIEVFDLSEPNLLPRCESQSAGGIPLIPNEDFAGNGGDQYNDIPIEEFYQIREFSNASFLLRVSGDSMSPKFKSGDLVACKKVEEVTFWQWHRVYAICTKNQGILIKRIEKGDTPDTVTCASENPAYDAFELGRSEIISVALVLGGIVIE